MLFSANSLAWNGYDYTNMCLIDLKVSTAISVNDTIIMFDYAKMDVVEVKVEEIQRRRQGSRRPPSEVA